MHSSRHSSKQQKDRYCSATHIRTSPALFLAMHLDRRVLWYQAILRDSRRRREFREQGVPPPPRDGSPTLEL